MTPFAASGLFSRTPRIGLSTSCARSENALLKPSVEYTGQEPSQLDPVIANWVVTMEVASGAGG